MDLTEKCILEKANKENRNPNCSEKCVERRRSLVKVLRERQQSCKLLRTRRIYEGKEGDARCAVGKCVPVPWGLESFAAHPDHMYHSGTALASRWSPAATKEQNLSKTPCG